MLQYIGNYIKALMSLLKPLKFFLLILVFFTADFAQDKSRVDVFAVLKADENAAQCDTAGKFTLLPKAAYPKEAKNLRLGGTVEILIEFNEKGKVLLVKPLSGQKLLQQEALKAAQRVKFQPPFCRLLQVKSSAVLTYNFTPFFPPQKYFAPARIEELIDVKPDAQFYQSILNLNDNYRLVFGYEDRRFYGDTPLTRGDFAQSLRLTLDFLSEKAAAANKIPRQINLFYSYNPQKITSLSEVKNFETNYPYAESVKILLLKYDIILLSEAKEFRGDAALTQNEVIDLWTNIFGAEAVPINFQKTENNQRLLSRGEFAVFLEESLQVLSYKVLP